MNDRRLEGIAWRLGEDDVILAPPHHLDRRSSGASAEPAARLFPSRPDLSSRVARGDLIVVDGRFGAGLREPAVAALASLGLAGIIARDFDPEFYSEAVRAGLLLLENPEAGAALAEGNRTRVDVETGLVHDVSTGQWYRSAEPRDPLDRLAV